MTFISIYHINCAVVGCLPKCIIIFLIKYTMNYQTNNLLYSIYQIYVDLKNFPSKYHRVSLVWSILGLFITAISVVVFIFNV